METRTSIDSSFGIDVFVITVKWRRICESGYNNHTKASFANGITVHCGQSAGCRPPEPAWWADGLQCSRLARLDKQNETQQTVLALPVIRHVAVVASARVRARASRCAV